MKDIENQINKKFIDPKTGKNYYKYFGIQITTEENGKIENSREMPIFVVRALNDDVLEFFDLLFDDLHPQSNVGFRIDHNFRFKIIEWKLNYPGPPIIFQKSEENVKELKKEWENRNEREIFNIHFIKKYGYQICPWGKFGTFADGNKTFCCSQHRNIYIDKKQKRFIHNY
jgi:hypothetical protein